MRDGGAEAVQQEQNGGDAANSRFRHCMQLFRMAYPLNLSQPPRVENAIFRIQGAEGCVEYIGELGKC